MRPPEPAGVDAPRSPGEEIARWADAARAGERSPAAELPQPRAADPFDFRPKQEPSLPHAPGAAGLSSLAAREPHATEPRLSRWLNPR